MGSFCERFCLWCLSAGHFLSFFVLKLKTQSRILETCAGIRSAETNHWKCLFPQKYRSHPDWRKRASGRAPPQWKKCEWNRVIGEIYHEVHRVGKVLNWEVFPLCWSPNEVDFVTFGSKIFSWSWFYAQMGSSQLKSRQIEVSVFTLFPTRIVYALFGLFRDFAWWEICRLYFLSLLPA